MTSMNFSEQNLKTREMNRKKILKEVLTEQITKYYPNKIAKIDTLSGFSSRLGYFSNDGTPYKNRKVSKWIK